MSIEIAAYKVRFLFTAVVGDDVVEEEEEEVDGEGIESLDSAAGDVWIISPSLPDLVID